MHISMRCPWPAAALVLIAVLTLAACSRRGEPDGSNGAARAPLADGATAPELTLPLADGRQWRLAGAEERQQPTVWVLAFWRSDRPQAEGLLPAMASLARATRHRGGEVMTVNVGQSDETVQTFLAGLPEAPAVALDADGRAARQFGLEETALPALFVLAADRRVVRGYASAEVEALPPGRLAMLLAADLAAAALDPQEPERIQQTPRALPAGPDAPTSRTWAAQQAAVRRGLTIEAYRQYGHRDPAWDAAAEALLTDYAPIMHEPPSAERGQHLAKLAQPALAAGCDDPLVLAVAGQALAWAGRPGEGADLLDRAAKAAETSDYPPRCTFGWPEHAYALYRRRYPKPPAEADTEEKEADAKRERAWQQRAGEGQRRLAESMAEADWAPGEKRLWLSLLQHPERLGVRWAAESVRQALEREPRVDPWLLLSLVGMEAVDQAWEARGSGYGDTVTEEGWAGFDEQLGEARQLLMAAWWLDRSAPEPASRMITVAKADAAFPNESRFWFDEAVAAELDFWPAYRGLIDALRPRWGGSHEALYAFGRECLATERYDLGLPGILYDTVHLITEVDGNLAFYREPGVYEDLRQAFEGRVAAEQDPTVQRNLLLTLAGVSWRSGHWTEAEQDFGALDERTGEVVGGDPAGGYAADHVAYQFGCNVFDVRAEIGARVHLPEAALTAAEAAWQAGDWAQAEPRYVALRHQAGDPWAIRHCDTRLTLIRMMQALEPGDGTWVDLQPGPYLRGWRPTYPGWRHGADGAAVVRQAAERAQIRCLLIPAVQFRPDGVYEVRGSVELSPQPTTMAASVLVGLAPDDFRPYGGLTLWIDPNAPADRPVAAIYASSGEQASADALLPMPAGLSHRFLVRTGDGRFSADAGDQVLAKDLPLPEGRNPSPRGNWRLGIGYLVSAGDADGVARFRDLQIRRLAR